MTKLRSFKLSKNLEEKIWIEIKKLGCDPNDVRTIKEHIVRLSNHFISANAKSPFIEKWAQVAYLAYYLPLNYLRAQAVCAEAEKINFFDKLDTAIDIGSGMGSLTLSLVEAKPHWKILTSVDASAEAIAIQRQLVNQENLNLQSGPRPRQSFDLAALSYSWNEFTDTEKTEFINDAGKYQALLIIEPSTSIHARNLMTLRSTLLQIGFHAWGPCTHQKDCPLLVHSKTDWCHDRIAIEKTPWMNAIEKLLPFKNETLTFSYLLMKRTPLVTDSLRARIIGDELVEKGKTRQAICRSDEREFFAWFPQRLKVQLNYTRGISVTLNPQIAKKSNELRVGPDDVT